MDVTINACEVLNLSGGEKIKTYESNLEIPDKIPDAQGEENEDNIKILSELSTSLDEDADTDPAKLDPAVLEVRVTTKVRSQQSDDAPSVHELGTSKFDNPQPPALPVCPPDKFISMVRQQEMALNLLSPDQLALLLQYVATLRQQRNSHQKALECALCKNNGRPISWYSSHALKDWRGRVLCPVLRAFRCPRCGATGDRAHTIKYCPLNNDAVMARRR